MRAQERAESDLSVGPARSGLHWSPAHHRLLATNEGAGLRCDPSQLQAPPGASLVAAAARPEADNVSTIPGTAAVLVPAPPPDPLAQAMNVVPPVSSRSPRAL